METFWSIVTWAALAILALLMVGLYADLLPDGPTPPPIDEPVVCVAPSELRVTPDGEVWMLVGHLAGPAPAGPARPSASQGEPQAMIGVRAASLPGPPGRGPPGRSWRLAAAGGRTNR